MIRRVPGAKILPWRRFWTPLGSSISMGHEGRGFLEDPERDYGRALNPCVFPLSELIGKHLLVLVGQPGIGKTTEVESLKADASSWLSPNEELISLAGRTVASQETLRRETVDSPQWKNALSHGKSIRLLFDGVDEALRRSSELVFALARWLENEPLDRIKVILVCRAAEWHLADGQLLTGLWDHGYSPLVYELCPLRWKDADLAARAHGIDPDLFFKELFRHQVTGLAARPITLKLVLSEMRRSGRLPSSHHMLFSNAIEHLSAEVDEGRTRHDVISRRKPNHIARVAARIAALSMVGARNVIVRYKDQCGEGEVSLDEIAVGHESVSNEKLSVDLGLVLATLDTPLFSFRGEDRYGFDHQTFAEHLAADYLQACTVSQLRRLLCVEFQGIERVAPQLAEVGARIALINSAWCDHLIAFEPELLLRADVSPLTSEQRGRAVSILLKRAECEEVFDDAGSGYFYSTFSHPGLADQLRPYIENSSYNPVVRRMAIAIAGDAKVEALEETLWCCVAIKDKALGFICNALDDLAGP